MLINNGAFSAFNLGLQIGGALVSPFIKVKEVTENIFPTLDRYTPDLVKQGLKWGEKALYCTAVSLEEMTDFSNIGGTKDPNASIQVSLQRLERHDPEFRECADFLAEQGTLLIFQQIDQKKEDFPIPYLIDFSKELIALTIKANILHQIAYLADQGYAKASFQDKGNPFGRILAVIGEPFNDSMEIELVDALPLDQQQKTRDVLLNARGEALLTRFFPNGAEDLLIFHHIIPVKLVKEKIWNFIQPKMTSFLTKICSELEAQPLDWEKKFDQKGQGLQAAALAKLPSTLLEQLKEKGLESFEKPLLTLLNNKGCKEASQHARRLIQFGNQFLRSQDLAVKAIGSSIEKYFMEQILFNFTNYIPDDTTTSLPQFLIDKWMEGNFFTLFNARFGGDLETVKKVSPTALKAILGPFGLDRKETFPLPAAIKEMGWPKIEAFQQKAWDRFVAFIPVWNVLSSYAPNQNLVSSSIDDPLFMAWMKEKGLAILSDEIEKFKKTELQHVPFFKEVLEKHLVPLLDKNNPSFAQALDFILHCGEGIVFQLCYDIFEKFKSSQGAHPDHFSVWLSKEGVKAFQSMAPAEFTLKEKEAFEKCLNFHQQLLSTDNADKKDLLLIQYKEMWKIIEPKFQVLSLNLFATFGYKPETLPVPPLLQSLVWNQIQSILPKLIFEKSGWILQPLLEKDSLRKEIEALPFGDQLATGAVYFAEDIVDHLPELVKVTTENLPVKFKDKISSIPMGDPLKKELISQVQSFLNEDNIAYGPIWDVVENYIEAMVLKGIISLSRLKPIQWDWIKNEIQEARKELFAVKINKKKREEEEILDDQKSMKVSNEKEIIEKLTKKIFHILEMEDEKNLYGVPFQIRHLLLDEIKKRFTEGLLGFYGVETKIRNLALDKEILERHSPLSNMEKTIQTVTHYVLDKTTDHLALRDQGELVILPKLMVSIGKWLDKMDKEKFKIATLAKDIIGKKRHVPFIETVLDKLDQVDKKQFVDWISPLLTNQVNAWVVPVLQKGSPDFDKKLLLAFLPLVTHHLKSLNTASKSKTGALNRQDVLEATGNGLHPSLKDYKNHSAKKVQEDFYQKQTAVIFKLIFPNGKSDIAKLFSDIPVTDELIDFIWETAQETIAKQVPQLLDAFLNRDFLVAFMSESFEESIEAIDKKLKVPPTKKQPLFKEGIDDLPKLDQALGEFALEAIHFLDIPFPQFSQLPSFAKRISNPEAIDKKLVSLLGKTVRKQFDKELLQKILQKVLIKLQKKKHIRMTPKEKDKAKQKVHDDFKHWERKLIEKSIEYGAHLASYSIRPTETSFGHPMIAKLVNVVLSVISLFLYHVILPLCQLARIDQYIVDAIFKKFDRATDKAIGIFSDPSLHDNLLFTAADKLKTELS